MGRKTMNLCVIPARGGSRRIPKKNIRLFHGRPIIEYSIETAQESGIFDLIIVSTDDPEIANVAHHAGAEVMMRSEEMSRDEVGTQEVMEYVLREQDDDRFKIACCIYATAPLMTTADLKDGYDLLIDNPWYTRYAFSVGSEPLRDAGQFYFGFIEEFLMGTPLITSSSIMVPIDEKRVCDINTEEDWRRAEEMYKLLRMN